MYVKIYLVLLLLTEGSHWYLIVFLQWRMNDQELHLIIRLLSVGLVDADPNTLHHIKEYRDLRGSSTWEGKSHQDDYEFRSLIINPDKGYFFYIGYWFKETCDMAKTVVLPSQKTVKHFLIKWCPKHLDHLFWQTPVKWTKKKLYDASTNSHEEEQILG